MALKPPSPDPSAIGWELAVVGDDVTTGTGRLRTSFVPAKGEAFEPPDWRSGVTAAVGALATGS